MTPEARQNEALQTRTTIGFSEVTGIISPQTELLLLRHPLANPCSNRLITATRHQAQRPLLGVPLNSVRGTRHRFDDRTGFAGNWDDGLALKSSAFQQGSPLLRGALFAPGDHQHIQVTHQQGLQLCVGVTDGFGQDELERAN
jgi:hypothetical protein